MSTMLEAITLDLNRIEELFQAPAANPFSDHAIEILGQSGIDFLRKRYINRWPKRRAVRTLLIRLPSSPDGWDPSQQEQLANAARAVIGRYCRERIAANRRARRLAMVGARQELLITLVVAIVAAGMLSLFALSEARGGGAVSPWLALLTIFAVFALALTSWDALESLFFDWTPFAVENMAYRWISSLEVHVAPQTAAATKQGTITDE